MLAACHEPRKWVAMALSEEDLQAFEERWSAQNRWWMPEWYGRETIVTQARHDVFLLVEEIRRLQEALRYGEPTSVPGRLRRLRDRR
jgi:hypothetical protein